MFKKDFLWGVATAAMQIEGAYLEDGKVPTVWDELSEGHVRNGETTHTACDHYHRYRQDVQLLKQIGVKSYRFSINWARIITDENGTVNSKGVAFYHNLIDELIRENIEPMVTMYHWELPMWAYIRGGWKNPQIIQWFLHYTKVLMQEYSGKVRYWITFNEPQCFVDLGYRVGAHAPFEKTTLSQVNQISRNVMLTHGSAVRLMRQMCKQPLKIGFAGANSCHCPTDDTRDGIEAARKRTFEQTTINSVAYWADPIMIGQRIPGQAFLSDEDMAMIHQPLDFYAFNTYSAALIPEQIYTGMPRNTLFWTLHPDCMYWSVKFYAERYRLPVLVSENGLANNDFVMSDGRVHDPQRVDFLRRYLRSLKKATDEYDVIGYQYWSFMDNFEWAEGYDIRFGMVYVDYRTYERTLKDSAYFYAEVINANGENL